MTRLPSHCPSCARALTVRRLGCGSCGALLEGDFPLPSLLALPDEDLRFVEAFVRASGSLKEMARQLGVSYPTVRNRLDDLIARLQPAPDPERRRLEILDAIAAGRLTVQEGIDRLKEMGS